MAKASTLRWLAVGLLLATGLIHIVYGAYYVGGAVPSAAGAAGGDYGYGAYPSGEATTSSRGAAALFYGMGAIYLVGVAALAANVRPRLFQRLALLYTALLLVIWAAAGARDVIAYSDKVIEVILVITLFALVRHKPVPPVPVSQGLSQATA